MTKLVTLRYTISMRTAKISELKANLSAHIRYVKRGHDVLILDRNTPVARLTSVGNLENYDDRIKRLIEVARKLLNNILTSHAFSPLRK